MLLLLMAFAYISCTVVCKKLRENLMKLVEALINAAAGCRLPQHGAGRHQLAW